MEEGNKNNAGGISIVLLTGILFGTIPIFAALLSSTGITTITQVTWRVLFSMPLLFLMELITERTALRNIGNYQFRALLLNGLFLLLSFVTFVG